MEPKNFLIDIAKIPISICSNDIKIIRWLKRKYSNFLIKNSKKSKFKIEIQKSNCSPDSFSFNRCSMDPEINFSFSGSRDIINICIDKKKSFSLIKMRSMKIRQLELVLGIVIYRYILPLNGGILLHAASIIKDNKGYIFYGPSGAGKSTVCKNTKGLILNDDKSLVRLVNKKFKIFNSTINCRVKKNKTFLNKSANLAGIFRLIKQKNNYLVKNKKEITFKNLKKQIKNFFPSIIVLTPEINKKLNKNIYNFSLNVPSYDLFFSKKCNFWPLLLNKKL